MAVKKRVKQERSPQQAVDVDALIEKGEHVPQGDQQKVEEPEFKKFLVRIPSDTLQEVDEAVKRRRVISYRNQWVLEAIYEKLEKERG